MSKPYTRGLHWPNKGTEGWGVVKVLLESMSKNNENHYSCPESYNPDPPDCIAKDTNGNLIGFEVTALVDSDEIKQNLNGHLVDRDWTDEQVIQEIQGILNWKDKKIFNGGPYSKKIVILHTHNITIEQELTQPIQSHSFNAPKQLDEAYVLLDYNPAIKRYPYIKLGFKKNNKDPV